MKKLYAIMFYLCGLLLFPSITAYAEVNPYAIIADTTIPETVLVDQDGVKITVTGLTATKNSSSTVDFLFHVQNTRDEDIKIFTEDLRINTINTQAFNVFNVPKKSSLDCILHVGIEELEENNIEHILTFNLVFDISTNDYKAIFETEELEINTSAFGQYEQSFDFSGTLLYDLDNIKIIARPTIKENYFGQDITLYIENNNEFRIMLEIDGISVNGKNVRAISFGFIDPGKKENTLLPIEWEELSKNGITNITQIEMDIAITSTDSGTFSQGKGGNTIQLTDLKVKFQ